MKSLQRYFLISFVTLICGLATVTPVAANIEKQVSDFLALSDTASAIQLIDKQQAVVLDNDVSVEQGVALFDLAHLYFRSSALKKSTETYWAGLKATQEIQGIESDTYLTGLIALAEVFEHKGNYIFAERMYQKGLLLAKAINGKESISYAVVLRHLGDINRIKSLFPAAEGYYEQSDSLFIELGQEHEVVYADLLVADAELFLIEGSFTTAEHLLRKAIGIYATKKVYDEKYAMAKRLLSEIFIELNNLYVAGEYIEMAINTYKKLYSEKHPLYAAALRDVGHIYLEAGLISLAETRIRIAKGIIAHVYGPLHLEYIRTIDLEARILTKQRRLTEADSVYQLARSTFEKTMGTLHLDYAILLADHGQCKYTQGNYIDALATYQHSLEIVKALLDQKHPFYERLITEMSEVYWADDNDRSAEIWFKKSTRNYVKHYRHYFAFLSEKEKNFHYEKIRWFLNKFNSFALERMEVKPSIIAEVYNNQLASKALLYHTTKEIKDIALSTPELRNDYLEWVRLKEALAKIYKLDPAVIDKLNIPLDSIETKAYQLEKIISLKVELDNKKNQDASFLVTWEQVRDQLKKGEAAVEMVRIKQFEPDSGGVFLDKVRYVALIVTPDMKKNPVAIEVPAGLEMEKRFVKYYRNAIKYQIKDELSYGFFWKPVADYLKNKNIESIYFSPDGVYNQVNLNTFYDPETNLYVIDQLNVNYVTNTKDIIEYAIEKPLRENRHSLLVGFPSYNLYREDDSTKVTTTTSVVNASRDVDFAARGSGTLFRGGKVTGLPGTKIEINSISEIFDAHGESYDKFLAREAYEDVVKNDKYFTSSPHIVHIATHGFFLSDNAMSLDQFHEKNHEHHEGAIDIELLNKGNEIPLLRSGLMFANASHAFESSVLQKEVSAVLENEEYEDGIFTAYEALNLNLSETELVVMSACETGLGVIKNGEGVYGLQRSFQTAGAKALIMSLWKVSDEATKQFMITFYTKWFDGTEKHIAFREAQKVIREKFPDPYFWGAFVMVGN